MQDVLGQGWRGALNIQLAVQRVTGVIGQIQVCAASGRRYLLRSSGRELSNAFNIYSWRRRLVRQAFELLEVPAGYQHASKTDGLWQACRKSLASKSPAFVRYLPRAGSSSILVSRLRSRHPCQAGVSYARLTGIGRRHRRR